MVHKLLIMALKYVYILDKINVECIRIDYFYIETSDELLLYTFQENSKYGLIYLMTIHFCLCRKKIVMTVMMMILQN